uniref:Putative ovule protein n=1 Tax=Solanum chacoense TaxID=4108 RepID=A0A0V0H9N3_SOLCH
MTWKMGILQSHPTLGLYKKVHKQMGDVWNGRWWYKLIMKMMEERAERTLNLPLNHGYSWSS